MHMTTSSLYGAMHAVYMLEDYYTSRADSQVFALHERNHTDLKLQVESRCMIAPNPPEH